MPARSPITTAMANPTAVVIKVCQALSRIGQRHCQPEAKIALGAGRMNGSMRNACTTNSHSTKIAMMTIQGSRRRSVLRRQRRRLRAGVISAAASVTVPLQRRRRARR